MPSNNPWWSGIDQTDPRFAALASANTSSGPAYDRVTSIPSWLPPERTGELETSLANIGRDFNTSEYDMTSKRQESRLLTMGLNAGNNAASDYANKARQAGGSGMGAGLVKAQASVGAQRSAGELALEREKFDAGQREKAATLAGQIAKNLGDLRDSYLKTIVSYATGEDSISAKFKSDMAGVDAQNMATYANHAKGPSGTYRTNNLGQVVGGSVVGNPFGLGFNGRIPEGMGYGGGPFGGIG